MDNIDLPEMLNSNKLEINKSDKKETFTEFDHGIHQTAIHCYLVLIQF